MSVWENSVGLTDEWYTPPEVFSALGVSFDMDVASPIGGPMFVPCATFITPIDDGLSAEWAGFVWMNPPFGGRNGLTLWLDKFFCHGNGIALTPDRTSAPWWQSSARKADAIMFTKRKVKFVRPDGSIGGSPGSGVTLWASGVRAVDALRNAQKNNFGSIWFPEHD